MTVIASAAGTRIDCDTCGHHVAAVARPPETLRLETGFVLHDARDWCLDCWRRHTRNRFARAAAGGGDQGPAAA